MLTSLLEIVCFQKLGLIFVDSYLQSNQKTIWLQQMLLKNSALALQKWGQLVNPNLGQTNTGCTKCWPLWTGSSRLGFDLKVASTLASSSLSSFSRTRLGSGTAIRGTLRLINSSSWKEIGFLNRMGNSNIGLHLRSTVDSQLVFPIIRKENLKVLRKLKILSKIKPHLSQFNLELQEMDVV